MKPLKNKAIKVLAIVAIILSFIFQNSLLADNNIFLAPNSRVGDLPLVSPEVKNYTTEEIDLLYARSCSETEEGMLFHIQLESADEVLLTGKFNQWAETTQNGAIPLRKINSNTWTVVAPKDIIPAEAIYEFKFIVKVNDQTQWHTGSYNTVPEGHKNASILADKNSPYFSKRLAKKHLNLTSTIRTTSPETQPLAKNLSERLNSPWGIKRMVFISPETKPFSKVGGVADVSGEYPQEMAKSGIESIVITPLYEENREKIETQYGDKLKDVKTINIQIGSEDVAIRIRKLQVGNITHYFLQNEKYADAPYKGVGENEFTKIAKAVFLSRGALEVVKEFNLSPDIIHANDWITGLVPTLMHTDPRYSDDIGLRHTKTITTIHNGGWDYQGVAGYELYGKDKGKTNLFRLLNIDPKYCDGVRDPKNPSQMNLLAAAIRYSDHLCPVSVTYAKELLSADSAQGLEGLFAQYSHKISGVVNGLDAESWKQEFKKLAETKEEAKKNLQNQLNLDIDPKKPIIGIVTRIAYQKGMDLVLANIERMLNELDVQFVFSGSAAEGDSKHEEIERKLIALSKEDRFRGKISVTIGYREKLANEIFWGSDMFLVPSLSEPCGMTQMIAMAAGTVPIVRAIGGLEDTVKDYNPETREGNGIKFSDFTPEALYEAIKRGVDLYNESQSKDSSSHWEKMRQNISEVDLSWRRPARQYRTLYRQILGLPTMKQKIQRKVIEIIDGMNFVNPPDPNKLSDFTQGSFHDSLTEMFVSLGYFSKDNLTEDDLRFIDTVVRHMENIITACLQLQHGSPPKGSEKLTQIWQLFKLKDSGRPETNFQALKEIYDKNPRLFITSAILHDIGKIEEYFSQGRITHETESRNLIQDLELLEAINANAKASRSREFLDKEQTLIRLIAEYHNYASLINTGEHAFRKINDILDDEEVRSFLRQDKNILLKENLKTLLEYLILIGAVDISASIAPVSSAKEYNGGHLNNAKVEYLMAIRDTALQLAREANYKRNDTMHNVSVHSNKLGISRIVLLLSLIDTNLDLNLDLQGQPSQDSTQYMFYIKKIQEALKELGIDHEGEEWQKVLETLDSFSFYFFAHPFSWLAWIDTQTDNQTAKSTMIERASKIEADFKINPQAIKLIKLLVHSFREKRLHDIFCDGIVLCNENGDSLYAYKDPNIEDYIINLNSTLERAKSIEYNADKQRTFFVDEQGHEILDGPRIIRIGTRLNVHLSKKSLPVGPEADQAV